MDAAHASTSRTSQASGEAAQLGDVRRAYAPYLERVRLLLQRYTLVFNPAATATPGQPATGIAYRALTGDPMPEDFRLTLAGLETALAEPYEALALRTAGPGGARFERVRCEFALSEVECDALWLLLAAALVPETLVLLRTLWGSSERIACDRTFLYHVLDPFGARAHAFFEALEPTSPLLGQRLVVALRAEGGAGAHEEADGQFVVSRRLVRHLLDVPSGLPAVSGLVALHEPSALADDATPLLDLLPLPVRRQLAAGFAGRRRFLLVGAANTAPLRLACEVMASQGAPLIEADLPALLEGGESALVLLLGEAKLRRAGIFIAGMDALSAAPSARRRQIVALLDRVRVPQFYHVACGPEARLRLQLADELGAIEIRPGLPEVEVRERLWRSRLEATLDADASTAARVAHAARAYPLGVPEIEQALALAGLQARQRNVRGGRVQPADVEYACHRLTAQRIGEFASRVEVRAAWDDLVLCEATREVLDEMRDFGRHRRRVFEELGFGEKMGYGRGLIALFWGPPGTGKTLAGGLVARELGLELYRVDLSRIVSKYIGETEQRLAAIFDEAEASGMAILFDEADSLFAGRTEVRTSVDRYANLEVDFLLQRLEHHDGLVILTTNFPANIDEAFMRRIRFKAEFPAPREGERERLWRAMIPARAALADDVDFAALAEFYELTGGEIRNAVLRAAFRAVAHDEPLSLEHLEHAARMEQREGGRLLGAPIAERRRRSAEEGREEVRTLPAAS